MNSRRELPRRLETDRYPDAGAPDRPLRRRVDPRRSRLRPLDRPAHPGRRLRRGHVRPPPEQVRQLRGAVHVPAVRRGRGVAPRHGGDGRPGPLPDPANRRRAHRRAGAAARCAAPADRQPLARSRRPSGGRRPVRGSPGGLAGRDRRRRGGRVLRDRRLADGAGDARPRRPADRRPADPRPRPRPRHAAGPDARAAAERRRALPGLALRPGLARVPGEHAADRRRRPRRRPTRAGRSGTSSGRTSR